MCFEEIIRCLLQLSNKEQEGLLSITQINPLQKAIKSLAAQKKLHQKSRKQKEKVSTGKSWQQFSAIFAVSVLWQ